MSFPFMILGKVVVEGLGESQAQGIQGSERQYSMWVWWKVVTGALGWTRDGDDLGVAVEVEVNDQGDCTVTKSE